MANQNEHSEADSMKAFYASFKSSKNTSPSHVSYFPREKTIKAILQDLFSKDFSLLLHPGRSILIKDTLKYLLTLQQNEGFCMTSKLKIKQLLQCFEQCSLEYNNASRLSKTAKAELSRAAKGKNDLKFNVKNFQELDMEEKGLSNRLVCLQEEKKELEEKIKMINVEIEKSIKRRDRVAKKQKELFQEGKTLKADWDEMSTCVPRLIAEYELANKMLDNIEANWSNIRQQFMPVISRVA